MVRTSPPFGVIALLIAAAVAVLLCACTGCRVLNVQRDDGSSVFYGNVGFDTAFDEATFPTAHGPATIKGARSQAAQAFTAGVEAGRSLIPLPRAPQIPTPPPSMPPARPDPE